MSNFKQAHLSRMRGTHRMIFALNGTEATQYTTPYRDLGNVVKSSMQLSGEKFEDFDMIDGMKVPIDTQYTAQMLDFTVTVNELGMDNLKLMLRAENGTAIAQDQLAAVDVDNLDFTAAPAVPGLWYVVTKDGLPIYNASLVVISPDAGGDPLTEGADFYVNGGMLMVRFTAARTDLLNVTVTAPEFSATPLEAMRQSGTLKGLGMWQYYDMKHFGGKSPAVQTLPFGCLLDYEEALEIVTENNAEAPLKIRTTLPLLNLIDYRV